MPNCDCPDCREERVYEPLRLRCKTVEQAAAFAVILTGMGAPIPPRAEGGVIVIPWAGSARFVTGLIEFATEACVAEPDDVRDLSYQATAQTMGTSAENVRDFGRSLVGLVTEFMGTVGSEKPPDVTGIINTLDDDLGNLLRPNRPEEG